LLEAKWLGGHAKPQGSWTILQHISNPDLSANRTYAWGDTNHNDPTHAALWTGNFSAAIMLTHTPG